MAEPIAHDISRQKFLVYFVFAFFFARYYGLPPDGAVILEDRGPAVEDEAGVNDKVWYPRLRVSSLSFACASLIVASPSIVYSVKCRKSSLRWKLKIASRRPTVMANERISRSKAAVASQSSSYDSGSRPLRHRCRRRVLPSHRPFNVFTDDHDACCSCLRSCHCPVSSCCVFLERAAESATPYRACSVVRPLTLFCVPRRDPALQELLFVHPCSAPGYGDGCTPTANHNTETAHHDTAMGILQ